MVKTLSSLILLLLIRLLLILILLLIPIFAHKKILYFLISQKYKVDNEMKRFYFETNFMIMIMMRARARAT
jgi:hypothetical protein